MNQQLLCQPYSEQVKYFGRDFLSKKLIGFCLKCVPTAQMPLKLIEDVEKEFEQKKSSWIKVIHKEKDDNITILTQLLKFLTKYKNEQINQSQTLKQEITQIQKFCTLKQEQIKGFNTLDLDELDEVVKQKISQSDQERKKEQILIQLKNIQSKTFLFESQDILSLFPSLKTKIKIKYQKLKTLNQENKGQQKTNIKLSVAIDFNVLNFFEKLLCLKCISEKPRQVMTIDDANKIWNDHQQLQQAQIQYQQLLQQTVSVLQNHISKCLEELKIKLEYASIQLEKLMNAKTKFIQQQIAFMKKQIFFQGGEMAMSNQTIEILQQQQYACYK